MSLPHQWDGWQGEWTIGTNSPSIEQGESTVRISPEWFPDVGNWNQSIPDTEKLMISRYQKMISQGIITDILISGGRLQLAVSSSNTAHDKQPTIAAGCIAILHKYSKRGGITTSLIKRYCVLCSKTYNTSDSCHYLPAGSRQAARGARICETSLLGALRQYRYHGYWALSYRDGIASWVIASWVVVTAELEIIASWDDRTSNC